MYEEDRHRCVPWEYKLLLHASPKTIINENNDNCEKYDPVSPLRDNCSIDVIISMDWSIY